MLKPKEFVARWEEDGDSLIPFSASAVHNLRLSDEDKAFLTQAGLPDEAAPFLSFEIPKSGMLATVAKEWKLTTEFERYRTIGSDGSGSPIALDDEKNGEVVCLDHDNRFARVLLNTSARQLAESLLAYRKMIRDSQAEFGDDAYLDGKTSPAIRHSLRQELTRIDPAAMKSGCFWYGELQNLETNAG